MYTYTHVHVHVHVRLKFCVTYMYIVHVHVSFMGEKVFPIGSYTCTCKYNIIQFVFFAKQLNEIITIKELLITILQCIIMYCICHVHYKTVIWL